MTFHQLSNRGVRLPRDDDLVGVVAASFGVTSQIVEVALDLTGGAIVGLSSGF
ncbi:hypothetical protein [Mycobacterium sp. GA-1285]|uniref:hypothetical protein n=1 Tax=Mycobacterium sp. GA-1285 TaxID=1772282 RepID=UPI000A5AAC6A|nr:hypothetical protein [Mycobacterium sp. GA-1285]